MEDVLEEYALPYDPDYPVICFDEKPYQLLNERREPIPMKRAKPLRYDNEYERMGTCSIFVTTEPLKGLHYAFAKPRRTAIDYAHYLDWLVNESPYKNAKKIKLIQDNLNTHDIASLYKAFPPQKARAIARKLEFHPTPKHGSWLNIAEVTISILERQCLGRRIPDIDPLNSELAAWQTANNADNKSVNWQFTAEDARVKLRRLYPVF
jgi:hypothetical protein